MNDDLVGLDAVSYKVEVDFDVFGRVWKTGLLVRAMTDIL